MPDTFIWDTLGFAIRAALVVVAIAAVLIVAAIAFRRQRRFNRGQLEVRPLHHRLRDLADALSFGTHRLKPKDLKQQRKQRAGETGGSKPAVYVLDFEGDILATPVESLREEVTAVLSAAQNGDEVLVRLESSGGAVSHYGLAAAQLARLREKKIPLTICIDRVAASGGYMMACVADSIVAAPFSIIGSIGVVAEVPNFHRLLKKHDVDFEEATAGEFKRTVSLLGEITEAGRKKFQEQLEETHRLFKDFVKTYRPRLEIDKVATGEFWLAKRAQELGLVDALSTSDDVLISKVKDKDVFKVTYTPERPWRERLGRLVAEAAEHTVLRLLSKWWGLQLR